jgi:hypothetical protein
MKTVAAHINTGGKEMSAMIKTVLERLTASANTTLASPYGGGTTWTDELFNFFYDWRWWAAIGSVVVLSTAGIFMLGRARLGGILMIVGGLFLGVFFARIDHFINITENQVRTWDHPNTHGNPFDRA